jgi:hypothetical protein
MALPVLPPPHLMLPTMTLDLLKGAALIATFLGFLAMCAAHVHDFNLTRAEYFLL